MLEENSSVKVTREYSLEAKSRFLHYEGRKCVRYGAQ